MTWNRKAVLRFAGAAACIAAFGCSTDFGNAGEFLACDAKGKCANEYTCAKTELGAVCMSKAQYKDRCGKPESCNGEDDDCNGITDEGFDGLGEPCVVGVGACERTGVRVCNPNFSPSSELEGERLVPTGLVPIGASGALGEGVACSVTPGDPTNERCDMLDNDCDGDTDEDLADVVRGELAVGVDDGECQPRIERCVDGGMVAIQEAITAVAESCDGADNDCDGATDEDLADTITGTTEGACDVRIERCVGGVPTVIQEGVEPSDETCNLVDDDCDSMTDDSVLPELRGFAIGECRLYVAECVNGERVVTQVGVDPVGETCDHRDNNCDGQTDEIFTDLGESCAVGVGECLRTGTWVCASDFSPSSEGELEGERCSATPGDPSAELCDGLDNNCDGATDETFTELGEACSKGVGACRATGDRICRDDTFGTQCDAEALEPTTEVCDGEDNDCNGQIDDGLGDACCIPGTNHACGINLGACTVGTRSCSQDRQWGACSGQQPVNETCDGLDNNCDGAVDEDIADCCSVGTTVACSITRGACVAGQQLCTNERVWDACSGVLPQSEVCDGADNDCDGGTDEDWPNVGQACSVGRGACAATGAVVCNPDFPPATICSVTAGSPTNETCNHADDDCDGEIDEGLVQRQGMDIGECQEGIERCVDGGYTVVQALIEPTDEVCDGADNDCDGATDEDAPDCCAPGSERTCGLHRGECRFGMQVCGENRSWGECSGILPTAERCDQRDNDCDGNTDEQWASLIARECTVGKGICARIGTWECNPDQGSSPSPPGGEGERRGVLCTAVAADPSIESCNALDDDCDGWADEIENIPPEFTGSDIGVCRQGISVCVSGNIIPVQTELTGSPEVCDGLDNNCDTFTDNDIESIECYDGPIGTEDVGVCVGGNTTCVAGQTFCVGQTLPSAETCNGQDDDCDGVTDGSRDGDDNLVVLAQPCYSGPSGTLGVGECRNGTSRCQSYIGPIAGVPVHYVPVTCEIARDVCYMGWWGECVGEVMPDIERCEALDGLDNDCDGRVDEWQDEMVIVPAGAFTMGSPDGIGNADEHPQHTVTLSRYCMDRYEVTNARYRACVNAGACDPPVSEDSRTYVGYFRDPTYDQYPVVNVTWYMADVFCRWEGKHLPTEAQWEKAARGTDGRTYPWGEDAPTCELARFFDCPPHITIAVDTLPLGASPYGLLHMAGNASEWIADWYDATYYAVSSTTDPTGPTAGILKVFRGGGLISDAFGIRNTRRGNDRMPTDAIDVGIRCVQ